MSNFKTMPQGAEPKTLLEAKKQLIEMIEQGTVYALVVFSDGGQQVWIDDEACRACTSQLMRDIAESIDGPCLSEQPLDDEDSDMPSKAIN